LPESKLRYISRCTEFRPRYQVDDLRPGLRGIYVLLEQTQKKTKRRTDKYDVVYIGMSNTNVRRRLRRHTKSKKKRKRWSHFSLYEVFDNLTGEDVAELEGLLRTVYRKDTRANRLNLQKRHKRLRKIRTTPGRL